jgi:hypothetical protein
MTIDDPSTGPGFNAEQKLSDGGLKPLADLIGLLRLGRRFAGMPCFVELIRSFDHPIGSVRLPLSRSF